MRTIIATNHHRRVQANTDTLDRLGFAGYHVIYQDTSTISYDQGMVNFKTKDMLWNFDIVAFIDNDLFMSGTEYFTRLLNDFISGGYGFCSYLVSDADWHYTLDGLIAPVTDQSYKETNDIYKFCPVPHWENAYMFLTRELWEKLTPDDLANSRNMIRAIHNSGAKMGTHKAGYKLTYSHFGPEWFHVGNLMKYYYIMENMDLSKLDLESDIDTSRIGLLLEQRNKYGRDFYQQGDFNLSLDIITKQRPEQFFLDKWKSLVNV